MKAAALLATLNQVVDDLTVDLPPAPDNRCCSFCGANDWVLVQYNWSQWTVVAADITDGWVMVPDGWDDMAEPDRNPHFACCNTCGTLYAAVPIADVIG